MVVDQAGSDAPVFDMDLAALAADPYPQLQRLQRECPIAWVPQLKATLITRFADIDVCEKNIEIFQSNQPGGLMTRLMGRNMMRKDGKEHRVERKQVMPSLSKLAIRDGWRALFQASIEAEIDTLDRELAAGPTDLVKGFATRVSAEVLKWVTGLPMLNTRDLDWASQSMVNGVANVVGDPDVEAECLRATAFLDRAIDDALADLAQVHPLGLTRHLSESGAGREAIQNNVKLAISGGQNETRDVLAGAIWAVLSHDLQATALDWNRVFDEFVRWMAPIGMSPRRIGADFEYAGVRFRQGSAAQLMFGVANRDPARFDQPDQFLPQIQRLQHMAFGAGPHFCAGAFVSRLAVAELSLPMLFDRLPTLELVEDTAFHGWAFRGPDRVVVAVA